MDASLANGLKEIGRIRARASKEIGSSKIGIGFETLDRKMFKPEGCYAALGSCGVKWARCQTGWNRCERVEGALDFAWLDEVVDKLLAEGIQPWFNVGYGNKLYMPDAPHEAAVGSQPLAYGEKAVAAWRRFVRELAARFKGRVSRFEIWNECNCDHFWRPGEPSETEYAKLTRISAEEIRAVQPEAKIAACVAGDGNEFVLGTLKAGIGSCVDAYSIHPYGNLPELNYAERVASLKALLARHAPGVEAWQGECGEPSQTLGHHNTGMLKLFNMDETKQAKWLLRRLIADLQLGLGHAEYFHAADLMESPYVQASGEIRPPVMMGVLNGKSYTPKKAFFALGFLCSLFDSECEPCPLETDARIEELGRCESKLPLLAIRKNPFLLKGFPLYAWHLPEDTQLETRARNVLKLSVIDDAPRRLERPVLVDLLQGAVFEAPEPELSGFESKRSVYRGLPLTDYPMILTDLRALEGSMPPLARA